MIIAICNNIKEVTNSITGEEGEGPPGARWIFELKRMSERWKVVSGEDAIKMIDGGYNPEDIFIIQEMRAKTGAVLRRKGAIPFLITCFESPLYAWFCYDKIYKYRKRFKYSLFYSGVYSDNHKLTKIYMANNFVARFPSYSRGKYMPLVSWDSRKDVVMVVSNKHYKQRPSFKDKPSIEYYIKVQVARLLGLASATNRKARRMQLHDERDRAIIHFSKSSKHKFDLYGHGWDRDIGNKRLKGLSTAIEKLSPLNCENKISTISNYKFTLCFENVEYQGYVTEKIIDCLVAGTIPIYMGAPDIDNFIPRDCYINYRELETLDALDNYLCKFDSEKANDILLKGREFLYNNKTENLFCHEDFARFINELVSKEVKANV